MNILQIFFLLLTILSAFASCKETKNENGQITNVPIVNDDTLCSCPHTTICLQPFDDFSQKEAYQLKKELEKHLYDMVFLTGEIKVLPNKRLTKNLLNDAKTRYRADKIINSLKTRPEQLITTIGLTHKDISIPYKGHADWGVLGLAFRPSTACVVSTFRLKHRDDLWKLATHEFLHAFYAMPHCANNNPKCIMQDAKGHANFSIKTGLCESCAKQCN